ncbi:MAG TPA: cupin domain-containing protein [Candidatus Limnocylindrales bacterium]|nr:cupin domain-containing protein [Candidatus Limnocylindrales bacterium]
MYHLAHVDWSFADKPIPSSARSAGLARTVLVGPEQGAVHTELAVGAFRPGGWLRRHIHSFEEALYVLAGELVMEIGDSAHRLVAGDYCFIPLGTWHALANGGEDEVRFLSVNTPQRLPPDADRKDTFFNRGAFDAAALVARATRPRFGSPDVRYVGHYKGTPPQAEALRLTDPARGRKPVGMDVALTVYSGISVKMLVDKVFGADLLTMFTVDYEPGGSAQQHDHPFEEAYFFLKGEIEAELDGDVHMIRAGDVVFSAVGGVHGFYNNGTEQVRWIETQAPQPPVRHAYRWAPTWTKFEEDNDVE